MAYTQGATVTTGGGRTGNVVFDNSAVTTVNRPGVIVLYADSTYTMEVQANLVNVNTSASWIRGIGPGQ